MIIKWNENFIHKKLVNPNLIHFKDWIDQYALACEDMPRTHSKNFFCERTHQRGKSKQKITARKNRPFWSQNHNLGKCQEFLSENVFNRQQTVRQLHLRSNCLSGHPKGKCNSKYRCQVDNSNGFHHSTNHRTNFTKTQQSNEKQDQSTSGYRHNGDNLNRNQFSFTNNSFSWNKNLSSANPNYNYHTRQNGSSSYKRKRSRSRYNNNYNNNSSINSNSNINTNYKNSNNYNRPNRNFHYRQSHQVPNRFNVQQQQPTSGNFN